MPTPPPNPPAGDLHSFQAGRRLQSLDVLRGVAVLLVLFRHIGYGGVPAELPGFLFGPLTLLERMGWTGVDLFFVLSGFLVSSLLFRDFLKHGRIDWKSFLIRRGLKIYPSFYLLMAVTVLIIVVRHPAVPASHLVGEFLFLQNYVGYFWNHTWTLAVEEHFYLALPLLLIAYRACHRGESRPFRHLPRFFIGLFVVVLGLRLLTQALAPAGPFDSVRSLIPTHLRIDSLAFGVLISYFHHFQPEAFHRFFRRTRYLLPVAALLCYLPSMGFEIEHSPFLYTFGFTLLYLGNGALVILALHLPFSANLIVRALARIGVYSYSIYLWHILVALSICPRLSPFLPQAHHESWSLLCYLAGSILFGTAMGKLVEVPVLKLRDRFFPSPSGTLAGSAD